MCSSVQCSCSLCGVKLRNHQNVLALTGKKYCYGQILEVKWSNIFWIPVCFSEAIWLTDQSTATDTFSPSEHQTDPLFRSPLYNLLKTHYPCQKKRWAKEVAYQGLIVFVSRMVWTGPKARLVLSSICKWIKRSIKFQLFFHFYKSKLKFRREFRKKLNADNWDLKRSPNLPWHLYYYCKPADVVEIRTWTRLPLLKKQ